MQSQSAWVNMEILVVFAHPDDETMLTGGTLALLARAGARVHYLCATQGEGGELGEPPRCTPEELGAVRAAELDCAVQALSGTSLRYLGYTDPRVGLEEELFAYSDDLDTLSDQIAGVIQAVGAGAVLTHGSNGEYGHPAHLLTHQAAAAAIEKAGTTFGLPSPALYTFSASFPGHPRPRLANQDDPAHLVLDITPALEAKIQAALCHRTQHALFVRRSSREAGRQLSVAEVIMRLESLHRHAPALTGETGELEADPLFRLLWNYRTEATGG